ncbi:hypothetical protein Scep_008087 [Stephania cephalantha]|uniref:Uncharacterized protein n=1 Tax=Stephania cephalantha TaxID=152367 RepID=A0AAP0KCA5_9MAGN
MDVLGGCVVREENRMACLRLVNMQDHTRASIYKSCLRIIRIWTPLLYVVK